MKLLEKKFNKVNSKKKATINNLEKKIPNGTTLIHINHYNIDKQNLGRKNWRS